MCLRSTPTPHAQERGVLSRVVVGGVVWRRDSTKRVTTAPCGFAAGTVVCVCVSMSVCFIFLAIPWLPSSHPVAMQLGRAHLQSSCYCLRGVEGTCVCVWNFGKQQLPSSCALAAYWDSGLPFFCCVLCGCVWMEIAKNAFPSTGMRPVTVRRQTTGAIEGWSPRVQSVQLPAAWSFGKED